MARARSTSHAARPARSTVAPLHVSTCRSRAACARASAGARNAAARNGTRCWSVSSRLPGSQRPFREGLDPLGAGDRVVDRAEHEVEAPEDLVGRHVRQALTKCGHERPARHVEVVGDQLVEQGRIFRREDGAKPAEARLAVTGLDLGQGRAHERFDDGFELEAFPPGLAEQLQPFGVEAAAMPPVHLRQQPFLAAEVVTHERPVHAGCRGDRPHRDVGVAVVREQPLRRGDQLVRRIGRSCRRSGAMRSGMMPSSRH